MRASLLPPTFRSATHSTASAPPPVSHLAAMMNNTSRARKRKADDKADEANDILRRVLGKRPMAVAPVPKPPASSARVSKHNVDAPAAAPNRREPVNLARLRSIVDGRVEDWKSKQATAKQLSRQKTSRGEGNVKLNCTSSPRNRRAPVDPEHATSPSDGLFRRFANEDPAVTAQRTIETARRKRKQSNRREGDRNRGSVKSESAVSSKPRTEGSLAAIDVKQEVEG